MVENILHARNQQQAANSFLIYLIKYNPTMEAEVLFVRQFIS